MVKPKPLVSVIIPCKLVSQFVLNQVIPSFKKQSYKRFEVILLPDKNKTRLKVPAFVQIYATYPRTRPADKRDFGVTKARGEIVAFIDDDVVVSRNWLLKAVMCFEESKEISSVCGPGLTPDSDSLRAQVSGLVWSTWIGAGGAGTYRCTQQRRRFVDDFPTFNLLVRKDDFLKIGGFSSKFWPGEDTKLCHDLVYKLNKKILYDPEVLVYHCRRPVFLSHLKQISRYGLHRGHFTKILPKTSRRLGYFIPFLFTLSLFVIPVLAAVFYPVYPLFSKFLVIFYLIELAVYSFFVLLTSLVTGLRKRSFLVGFLLYPGIVTTHLVFGFQFGRGLLKKNLDI
ncbi:MAG: glycosyltransferase [Patescibacteria group bacterium]|jgi:cellulose synthase/poly-beta-1,6-N-acetylglucosamine synthase-like glycosyltransferase